MIEITYPSGKVRNLDAMPEAVGRRQLAASFMNVPEMTAFFQGQEAKAFAKVLGLDTKGAEKDICARICRHFWG